MNAGETRSRRAVITGGLGSLVGLALGVLGGPSRANAATGDYLTLGHYTNSADKFTQLMVTGLDPIALEVDAVETGGNRVAIKGVGAGLGSGVAGSSTLGVGLSGESGTGRGVYGSTLTAGDGVVGEAKAGQGAGLRGISQTGRGAIVSGGAAQLRLVPSGASTHPVIGQRGDLFLDKAARLWLCTKGGSTATWRRVQLV